MRNHSIKINRIVKCDGSSLWGDTKGLKVKVKSVKFEITPDSYCLVWVFHDKEWTIYTDRGFEGGISWLVSEKLGFPVKLMYTEQGMQEDGIVSMETTSKRLSRYFDEHATA